MLLTVAGRADCDSSASHNTPFDYFSPGGQNRHGAAKSGRLQAGGKSYLYSSKMIYSLQFTCSKMNI